MKVNFRSVCTFSSAGHSDVRARPVQPGGGHVYRSHRLRPRGPQVTPTQPHTNPLLSSSYHLVFLHIHLGLSKRLRLCDAVSPLRFYGNRSHCYWCLEQYYPALTDAQRYIQLAPDWPKGYFRKGCALMGLKVSTCSTTDEYIPA